VNIEVLPVLLFSLVVPPQEAPWIEQYQSESAAANKTCAAKEFVECRSHLIRLKDLVDGRGDAVYRLAKVEASLGNRATALDWLSLYSKMGLRLADPMTEAAFDSIRDSADFQSDMTRLKAAAAPVSTSRLFATLPEKDLIAEDITYDRATDRFYVSSVRHRKIISIARSGTVTDFRPEGEWPILALAADSAHRILWATSAALPEGLGYNSADEGKSAILKFNLDSGEMLKRYDMPPGAAHELGDMTLSGAGDAYVSDARGSVFLIRRDEERVELLLGPGTFRSPQTPAVSRDGRTLLVPDYSRGISVVNLATKKSKLLAHPADLSLGGIDGLYLAGRTVVAIQNGTTPKRLIRMHMDAGLTRVLRWETIEANWKGLGEPTHGVRVGKRFYFIANSGWDVKPGGAFESPVIRVMSWK
jgi:sugar lactone lactonase YvrE